MAQEKEREPEERGVHVDEEWKRAVAEEKERLRQQEKDEGAAGPARFPEPSIEVFMAGLYTQTLVALGELENPATGERRKDTAEAQYLIDTVALLRQKTEPNLTPQERTYVDNILYDLRMRYVNVTSRAAQERQQQAGEQR